jgi:hypothetical protein
MSRAEWGDHFRRASLSEPALSSIRILLAAMPRMMHDIVETAIRSQPDMLVVGVMGAMATSGALSDAIQRAKPDVVILGPQTDGVRPTCEALLLEHPHVRLLEVADDGRGATLCELRPYRVTLGDVSLEGLMGAIRGTSVEAS